MACPDPAARNRRFAVLSQSSPDAFSKHWLAMRLDPVFEILRGPETGLVSIRGRLGGGGAPFPFGDATATRATVRLADGRIGHSMLLGRDRKKVTIAAVIDALCQNIDEEIKIERTLIAPLSEILSARDSKKSAQTAATKVDFFTMVRGEDL